MWKRNSDPPKPTQPEQQSRPAPAPEPVITPTARVQVQSVSIIGETMRIKGDIKSREDMQINGHLEGKLDSENRLTVGSNGKLIASVKAREADIGGTLEGNIEAVERVVLRKGANLVGDVRTGGITIEDGAYFKGGIDIAGAGKR